MPHRLMLKVSKFKLTPPKRLGTVTKNILESHHAPPPPPPPPISDKAKSERPIDTSFNVLRYLYWESSSLSSIGASFLN